MSLLSELQSRGVTIEDLEKAASVRLFEKAAAAEGVDLDNLSEDDVVSLFENFTAPSEPTKEASAMNEEILDLFEKTASSEGIDLDSMEDEDLAALFEHYVENVLPEQLAEEEYEEGEKEASADDVLDLFEKTASDEGIDLDEMSDEDLVELYEHYVENVLPEQLADGFDDEDEEKVADAQEKLAEAEILGRHMARAYMDEMDKEALSLSDVKKKVRGAASRAGEEIRALRGKSTLADRARRAGRGYVKALKATELRGGAKRYGGRLARLERKITSKGPISRSARRMMLRGGAKTLGAYGAPLALAGMGAAAMDKRSDIFTDEEIEALLLIDENFGEEVAEDVAEKLAFDISQYDERAIDRGMGSLTAARGAELLTGSRFKGMTPGMLDRLKAARGSKSVGEAVRTLRGKNKPGVIRSALGVKGSSKRMTREARKVLAARGLLGAGVGGALAAAGGAGYAAGREKRSSAEVEDFALALLDAAGYDV
jgi:hypothetical protein